MAKIALIGASGNAGRRILAELSQRGHDITAIARQIDKIDTLDHVTAEQADIFDVDGLTEVLKGHDAVISSVHFLVSNASRLVEAIRQAGVKRYLVVGGAGTLQLQDGTRLLDSPQFPSEYRAEAVAGFAFLEYLKTVEDIDWTFLSPSAMFIPGQRTGQFRLDKDQLISNAEGSSISFEDYAIALVDELENPQHIKQRFTVGY